MTFSVEVVETSFFPGAVADEIVACAREFIPSQGSFSMALSGGSTPGGVYRQLTSTSRGSAIEWDKVKLFIGDERWVPIDNVNSNYRMVQETLLSSEEMAKAKCFHVDTSLSSAEDGARAYSDTLVKELPVNDKGVPVIDLVLLGLGTDGHIASLFPESPLLADRSSFAVASVNPSDESVRVSLAPAIILAARRIVFLVKGAGKANILKQVIEQYREATQEAIDKLPALLTSEVSDRVAWYVDSAAAAKLPASLRS